MMVRRMFERFVLGAMALSGLASLGGCNDDRWTDYSYKMTVYVGDKAYSTVRNYGDTLLNPQFIPSTLYANHRLLQSSSSDADRQ